MLPKINYTILLRSPVLPLSSGMNFIWRKDDNTTTFLATPLNIDSDNYSAHKIMIYDTSWIRNRRIFGEDRLVCGWFQHILANPNTSGAFGRPDFIQTASSSSSLLPGKTSSTTEVCAKTCRVEKWFSSGCFPHFIIHRQQPDIRRRGR